MLSLPVSVRTKCNIYHCDINCYAISVSTFTKGEQMVHILNEIGTHCAVFGNHDFDHGLEVLSQWVPQTNFPWLMSNVLDNETGRPLGEGKITHVFDWNGHRIGLFGLVEKEWLDALPTINPNEVTFLDFVDAGRKLTAQLKQEVSTCYLKYFDFCFSTLCYVPFSC